MKIIKAMIKKHRTPTETGFQYPTGWNAEKINVLAYEDSENMGERTEFCIALIHDDEYARNLIELSNGDIEELDEETANILGDKCKPQRYIVDEECLPEILVAISKNPQLRTKIEKAMLDTDDETTPGLRKTPKFTVRKWFPDN